ncbi:MAG: hypothetical protein ACI9FR_000440 [Cryomorphaceae bacterium]|jgi:hypothetical protein
MPLVERGIISSSCSLIKIDLDGYDLKGLQGAYKLLKSSRPVTYGEFSAHCMGWHGQTHKNVEDYMQALDYKVYYTRDNVWRFSQKDF